MRKILKKTGFYVVSVFSFMDWIWQYTSPMKKVWDVFRGYSNKTCVMSYADHKWEMTSKYRVFFSILPGLRQNIFGALRDLVPST